jgi:hypothetical protein
VQPSSEFMRAMLSAPLSTKVFHWFRQQCFFYFYIYAPHRPFCSTADQDNLVSPTCLFPGSGYTPPTAYSAVGPLLVLATKRKGETVM